MSSAALLSFFFLVVFSGAFATAGLFYPGQAATMPMAIGGIGAGLSLLQLVRELMASRPEPVDLARDVPIYLWVWAFIIAFIVFGFLYAAPVMVLLYLRLRGRESWRLSVALALAVLAVLYGVFETLLAAAACCA
jgi:hypothetical protein